MSGCERVVALATSAAIHAAAIAAFWVVREPVVVEEWGVEVEVEVEESEKVKVKSEKVRVKSEKVKVKSEEVRVKSEKVKVKSEKVKREERARVEAPPSVLNKIVPRYPRSARKLKHEGKVTVEAMLDGDGAVVSVRVASSSGFHDLDEAALEAVRNGHFAPAKIDGTGVSATLTMDFEFRLTDR